MNKYIVILGKERKSHPPSLYNFVVVSAYNKRVIILWPHQIRVGFYSGRSPSASKLTVPRIRLIFRRLHILRHLLNGTTSSQLVACHSLSSYLFFLRIDGDIDTKRTHLPRDASVVRLLQKRPWTVIKERGDLKITGYLFLV